MSKLPEELLQAERQAEGKSLSFAATVMDCDRNERTETYALSRMAEVGIFIQV